MITLTAIPENPRDKRWRLVIDGRKNGFGLETKYFDHWDKAFDYARGWLSEALPM